MINMKINRIEDIEKLKNYNKINSLRINIKILNFKLFENIKIDINKLYCSHNQIQSFEGLKSKINNLFCSYNQIQSFE